MLEDSTATLKAKMGLLASGFGGDLPLKACRGCMMADMASYGTSYWRTAHQIPGVWICNDHSSLLEVSRSMQTGSSRYAWNLPHPDDLSPFIYTGASTSTMYAKLTLVASICTWLLRIGVENSQVDQLKVKAVLTERLRAAGLMSSVGRLRASLCGQSFYNYFAELRAIPEFSAVAVRPSAGYSQLLSILQGRERGRHPLRIVTISSWLFDDVNELADAYAGEISCDDKSATNRESAKSSRLNGESEQLSNLLAGGMSITAAAHGLHISVATAQAWATRLGYDVATRPYLVDGRIRRKLVEVLRDGLQKKVAAELLSVSESTVNRVLMTENGLYSQWKEARNSNLVTAMRTDWMKLTVDENMQVKLARALVPKIYAWLYRNDRVWLRVHNRTNCVRIPAKPLRVDWRARDSELSAQVFKAALRVRNQCGRVRLLDVVLECPELKSKLSCLDQLPLTKRALESVVRKPTS